MTDQANPHEGTVELEACPFCGGAPRIGEWATFYVACTDCGAKVIDLTRADAIATWNLRTPARPAPTDVEAEAVLLLGARHVLRDLHQKNPECGYGKMAAACEAAALRAPAVPREVEWVLKALKPFADLAHVFKPGDTRKGLAFTTPNLSPRDFHFAREVYDAALRASPTGVGS